MSRTRLSLYRLDRAALRSFEVSLRECLAEDHRSSLVTLLGLHGDLAGRIERAPHAVDPFLALDTYPPSSPLFAALRRVAKQRALSLEWTSDAPSLEGRLQAFDGIRADPALARAADALVDKGRVPWFLRRQGGTCGLLSSVERAALAVGLEALDEPPPELLALAEALGEIDGDVLCHDALS
jgi:hypothetical protein